MILDRLRAYWEEQPDAIRPGYQNALLTKHIMLDMEGNLVGAIPLGDGAKQRGKRFQVPREQPQRTSGVRPRLVHDNGRYVLGLLGEGDKPERVAQAHNAYLKLLREAYEQTQAPAFAAVLRWLSREDAASSAQAVGVEAADELRITVEGQDPTESEAAAAFWNRPAEGEALQMRCLVTGEMAEVGKAMPYPIKPIPGGQMSGNMLVSVNFAAAQSYGLEGNLNSPISKSVAEAVCNALNRLLSRAENSFRVGETVFVYWIRGEIERDALGFLKDPEAENVISLAKADRLTSRIEALIESPVTGRTAKIGPKDFVAIALTANASRIVVRDYEELTLPELKERIEEWFGRLRLQDANGKRLRRPKLVQLAFSAYRDKKDMPKHVPVALLHSALSGDPLPQSLLATAVRRNVIEQGPYSTYLGQRRMSYARLALIKACLLPKDFKLENDPLSALNTDYPNPAYHCGRLLAVIDNIQRAYFRADNREINRTVVDRHYGGTSTAPGISFGPLLADATQAHLGKLQRDRRTLGTYTALERELRDVLEKLPEFPLTLDHREQGLFALGFYHQRTDTIRRAMERKAKGEADLATDALIETAVISSEDETE